MDIDDVLYYAAYALVAANDSNAGRLPGVVLLMYGEYFPPEGYAAPPVPKADPANGALVRLPGTIPAGCETAKSAAIHPGGRFVYFGTDAGAFGNVCAYAFDPVARNLAPVAGTPYRAGIGTRSIAIDPAGAFLYAANLDDGSVSGFAIDRATGALTPVPGSPYPAVADIRQVVADPRGRFVYAVGSAPGRIAGFRIDRGTGALTPLAGSPYPGPQFTLTLAVEPRGKYLYASGNDSQAFAIDTATGALTPIGPRFAPAARGMAVDPSGRYLFATTNTAAGAVASYRIAADGTAVVAGAAAPAGEGALGIAVSKSGNYVYTANLLAGTISGFRVNDATGELGAIPGSPFLARPTTYALATWGPFNPNTFRQAGDAMSWAVGVMDGRPPYAFALIGGALPPGIALLPDVGVIQGTPTTPGDYAFTLQVTDSVGATATKTYNFKVTGGATVPALATAVEYYNQSLDHYFITYVAEEIAKLDAGTVIKGWTRTGKSIPVYTAAQSATSPVCRYYIPPGLGDSHFFGRGTVECNATGQKNPSFVLEDPAFMHMILPAAGVCPASTTNVYRVFSNRPDANHRYTTDKAIRDQMVAQGWLVEGDGPDLVVMCAPV